MFSIVLIPGAGGDAGYWRHVAPLLRDRGFDVIAPDLPAADESADLETYTDAVVDAVGERRDLVVVGQSLGAFTAVALAERIPVRLLVFVAGMVPVPGETAGEWWEATGQAEAVRAMDRREGRDPDRPFDEIEVFLHDLPPEVLEEELGREATGQSGAPFASAIDGSSWTSVPARAVAGANDRLFPLDFMRAVVRDRLGIEPDVIDSGHLPALARPAELARLIAGYVEQLGGTAEGAPGHPGSSVRV